MHPGDPGTVCSRRKQWGHEVISGYSLTGEKCTVREPGQPGSKAVCTGLLQFASRRESSSLYPLCLLLMYGSRRLCRAISRCSAPSVSPPLLHTWKWLVINYWAQSWTVMLVRAERGICCHLQKVNRSSAVESTLFLPKILMSHSDANRLVTPMISSGIHTGQYHLHNNQEETQN